VAGRFLGTTWAGLIGVWATALTLFSSSARARSGLPLDERRVETEAVVLLGLRAMSSGARAGESVRRVRRSIEDRSGGRNTLAMVLRGECRVSQSHLSVMAMLSSHGVSRWAWTKAKRDG
jgi:hypothetical protein